MEAKHTPGPWLIHPMVETEYSIFNQEGTVHIGEITIKEDARLIAAAPEMLSLIQDFLAYGNSRILRDNMIKVIKKATGNQ